MRIITANIRKSDADDGANGWQFRSQLCCDILAQAQPDVLCLQEARDRQRADLAAALPDYQFVGVTKTAHCPHPINGIFFRSQRFQVLSSGGYWLSETPHIPGSRSWGSASIRNCTWVRLYDTLSNCEFRVSNCHLDHISEHARHQQLAMLLADCATLPSDYPQFICGDFNADATTTVLHQCTSAGWSDSYAQCHGPVDPGPTAHNFLGPELVSEQGKIDWILVRGSAHATAAAVLRDHDSGRYPSDHYFITADFQIPCAQQG